MREICNSRTYQLSIQTNKWNETDEINFSHAKARRLPAEVLYDSVYAVTGATPNIPGAGKGVRASQLYDAKQDLKSGFLANLGRPVRESACECERSDEMQMSAVMAFLSGPAIADAIGAEKSELVHLVKKHTDDRKLVEEIYYRVLNRAPKSAEVEAALASLKEIGTDHATLIKRLSRAEADWVAKKSELETARFKEIAKAQAAIDEYLPIHLANKRKAEAEQRARIVAAAKAVQARTAELPKLTEEFVNKIKPSSFWTKWRVLPVSSVTASDKSKVEKLPDGSIRSAGGNKSRNLDFLLTSDLKNQKITGLMIESIPDETFGGFGAGLNNNGNFVISEVQSRWNTKADPKKVMPLAFSDAKADYNQKGFSVKNVFNGKVDRADKGWALAGSNLQAPHRAMLKYKKPFNGDQKGSQLVVGILCRYGGGEYPIGRFRIWYTSDVDPLLEGIPAHIGEIVTIAPQVRTPEQKKILAEYVRDNDEDYLKKKFEHLKQQRPLPSDPKLIALQNALKIAQAPVQEALVIKQLRQDMNYSNQQIANRRLTAAQDLTWALINNPSFLFNR